MVKRFFVAVAAFGAAVALTAVPAGADVVHTGDVTVNAPVTPSVSVPVDAPISLSL